MAAFTFDSYAGNLAGTGLLPEDIKGIAGQAIQKYNQKINKGWEACGSDEACKNDLVIEFARKRNRKLQGIRQNIQTICAAQCVGFDSGKG